MNRKAVNAALDSERISIARLESSGSCLEDEVWTSLYGHSFIEDVRNSVMPIGGRSRIRPDFAIRAAPDDPSICHVLVAAFGSRDRYHRSSLTEALSEFIEDAATYLALYGVVHFEIVTRSEAAERGRSDDRDSSEAIAEAVVGSKQFRVYRIPGRIVRIPGYHLQVVPRTEWSRVGRRVAPVPRSRVWTLRIPSELGGRRRHLRFLRTLVRASSLPPGTTSSTAQGSLGPRGFDMCLFHETKLLAIAAASMPWGWDARNTWQEHTLEYFWYYRRLRFALSMAILREYIIESINQLLRRVGMPAHLILQGLPSVSEIRRLVSDLEENRIGFGDALKAVDI